MNYPKYNITRSEDADIFEFTSIGNKGNIDKIVEFSATDHPRIYNLAFGDKRPDGTIDDMMGSKNGDLETVLATVAIAVYEYTARYPDTWVVFSGSTPARTRLYRMALTKNMTELQEDFHIFGLVQMNGQLQKVPFTANTEYVAFLAERKIPA